jgi:hypothetical protein
MKNKKYCELSYILYIYVFFRLSHTCTICSTIPLNFVQGKTLDYFFNVFFCLFYITYEYECAAYDILFSQWLLYMSDFLDRGWLRLRKLLNKGFLVVNLNLSLKKHRNRISQYKLVY